MEWVIFLPAAALALAGGVGVIASRQPVHSALSLLVVLASLAVTYLILAAQFIAVLQVIVYAGAIVVLFLFVIMLLHAQRGEGAREKLPRQRAAAFALGAIYLVVLATAVLAAAGPLRPVDPDFGTAQSVGESLFGTYVLPFELASIILLVGMIAATILTRRESGQEPR
jgi:NADH-quinone oxidoreductase subunit J